MRNFLLVIVLIISGAIGYGMWRGLYFMFSAPGEESEIVYFDVLQGQSLTTISENLYQQEMIKDPLMFKIMGKILGTARKLRTGEYELHRGMTPMAVINKIVSGQSVQYSITFPEGINIFEMAQIIEDRKLGTKTEFLRLCKDPAFVKELLGEPLESLEGYLFPETYIVTKFTGEKKLITQMVDNFKKVYAEVLPSGQLQMPRHEHVTLASIVEKETGAPGERPMIASVFHNRLIKSMRLQSDPTIIYGILDQNGGEPVKNITKQDIITTTPYNTYKIEALPVGPIANPGKESLLATLNPAESDNFYFVSRNDGTHIFTKTYEEHSQAVRTYQLDPKMREGKSWRDLSNAQ